MDRNDVDWNGYWIATTTPFKKDGSLDEAALRQGMRSYPGMGIRGVLVNGTSGEWFSQTNAERRRVAQIAAEGDAVILVMGPIVEVVASRERTGFTAQRKTGIGIETIGADQIEQLG